MSDPIGLMTFLAGNIDAAMDKFVVQTSAAVSAGIAPLVAMGITIWCILYGMASMRGEVATPLMGFVKQTTKLSLICGIAITTGVFQDLIVGGVYGFLDGLTQIVSPGNSTSIFVALDQYDKKATEQALVIMGHGMTKLPTGGYLDIVASLILQFTNALLMILCGGFAVVAKVSLSLVLALGPLFIASLAFAPIARLFESWLSTVLSKVLLGVYLAAVLSFALVISNDYMDRMIANTGNVNAISDAFGFVIINGVLLVVAYQLPQLAAGLTGGVSVTGGGLAGFLMGRLMGRGRGGNGGGGGSDSGGGGSVSDASGSAGSSGASSGASSAGRTPAYRRATLERLQMNKGA